MQRRLKQSARASRVASSPQRSRWRLALCALFLLLLVLASACGGRVREITLLSINDFHGSIAHGGVDARSGRPWGGALALAAQLHAQRERARGPVFFLDGGDEMQGTPESNFTYGRSTVALLNHLRVDAAALGNHEFDWGIDTLRARITQMQYPMLAANVFDKESGRRPPWLRPWAIVPRDGIRLGVIGFATPETPQTTLPERVESLRFDDPGLHVDEMVRAVRSAGADLVVVLCHIGAGQERDGTVTGNIATLARASTGIDAFVGGHRHGYVAGSVDGVPVVVAGSRGRALGRIVLRWDGKRVRGTEVSLLHAYADSLRPADLPAVASLVDSLQRLVRTRVERVVGYAPRRLDREALVNLVTDAMREAVGADVAITNIGGVRTDLQPGEIRVGDLFELLPFGNVLVTVRMRGAALRDVLDSSPGAARVSGLRGRFDANLPRGQRVRALWHDDGTPLQADSTYIVVTNNFMAQGGDGFEGFASAPPVQAEPLGLLEVVQERIERQQRLGAAIEPEANRRWIEAAK